MQSVCLSEHTQTLSFNSLLISISSTRNLCATQINDSLDIDHEMPGLRCNLQPRWRACVPFWVLAHDSGWKQVYNNNSQWELIYHTLWKKKCVLLFAYVSIWSCVCRGPSASDYALRPKTCEIHTRIQTTTKIALFGACVCVCWVGQHSSLLSFILSVSQLMFFPFVHLPCKTNDVWKSINKPFSKRERKISLNNRAVSHVWMYVSKCCTYLPSEIEWLACDNEWCGSQPPSLCCYQCNHTLQLQRASENELIIFEWDTKTFYYIQFDFDLLYGCILFWTSIMRTGNARCHDYFLRCLLSKFQFIWIDDASNRACWSTGSSALRIIRERANRMNDDTNRNSIFMACWIEEFVNHIWENVVMSDLPIWRDMNDKMGRAARILFSFVCWRWLIVLAWWHFTYSYSLPVFAVLPITFAFTRLPLFQW